MKHYSALASLFSYPNQDLAKKVSEINETIINLYPENQENVEAFLSFVEETPVEKQTEYYIKTFDIQALCYLDIGYILFGEDYKRGEFLVNLRNEHIKAKSDCGSELADHLPNMLRLLPKIADKNFAEELGYSIMIPALKEMLKTFEDKSNVYRKNLVTLLNIMETDFKDLNYKQFVVTNNDKTNFLKNINCNPHACKSRK
ncbi:MAG: hypothetical protein HN704_12165 [Bacteroidetes bacterium]|jgi:nitrate reductase molybdenum cofactor assembly chaperone|nr:hypothetical protein [Bacteroidota bacterium]MBT6687856.1 hypothetical protein [Bacteroidota bacterium]MBT7142076.1 hypothetical protein [Bacteroidota bacterium]MBT7492347.1 hypothetical protein [Bacteroidota bacterium]